MEIILTIQTVPEGPLAGEIKQSGLTDVNMVKINFSLSVLSVGMWEIYIVYKFKSFKV